MACRKSMDFAIILAYTRHASKPARYSPAIFCSTGESKRRSSARRKCCSSRTSLRSSSRRPGRARRQKPIPSTICLEVRRRMQIMKGNIMQMRHVYRVVLYVCTRVCYTMLCYVCMNVGMCAASRHYAHYYVMVLFEALSTRMGYFTSYPYLDP